MARHPFGAYQHDWTGDGVWVKGETPVAPSKDLTGATELFTAGLPCLGYWSAQVTINVDYAALPTDDVLVSLYGSAEGDEFDTSPLDTVTLDNSEDPGQTTIMLWNPPAYLRIGLKQSGGTDAHAVTAVRLVGFG